MLKNRLIRSLLGLLLIYLSNSGAHAQSNSRKLEVAAQFTTLRLKEPNPRPTNLCFPLPILPDFSTNVAGFGGRATYNFSRKFALEGQVNYFPKEHFFQADPRWQGLFGVKTGFRKGRVMISSKARPGFLYFDKVPRISSIDRAFLPPFGCVFELITVTPDKEAVFNMDLGGTVEFYASKRLVLRLDLGDTLIRYPTKTPVEFNPAFTTHNVQISAGVGFRF